MSAPLAPTDPPAPPTAGDLESALRQAAASTEPAPPTGRAYGVIDTAAVLATFAVAMLLFDSQGLLGWAQRLELGPAQAALVGALRPLHDALDQGRLTVPRRALDDAAERVGRALGGGDDPLLADGWIEVQSIDELEVVEATPEPAPPAPEPATPPAPLAAAGATPRADAITVLLLGDSMIAGSLGTALAKQLEKNPRLRTVQAFQTATGLSRPDVYDWMKVLPPLLERERPRLVIASFGANDATTIRDGARTLEFGEPGWRQAYAARVQAMMRSLAGDRTQVLWLGLPPMRDARYAQRTSDLNRLFSSAARRVPRVEFLELEMLVAGERGGYATFVRSPEGKLTRFRLDDGVHYSPAGARAVARWGVDWVNERLRSAARP
jgi:uncharacterized protein